MIGIEAIGIHVPSNRKDNFSRMGQFGIDENFIKNKTGMLSLAVKNKNEDTSDLCVSAFQNLQAKTPVDVNEIECVLVCTQNPDEHGIPHTSAIVHDKLDLPTSCAAFDVSLGCSGYVYCLSIIQGFMVANNFKKGLLITADPYSKIIDEEDKNTSLLFGDAATATLISDTPIWQTGKFLFGSKGAENKAIRILPESNKLEMNGRAVFTFTASVIPKHIEETLTLNNLNHDDIDIFALHQGSRYIIETLQKRTGISPERMPFVAAQYGNTVSSSIPLVIDSTHADAKRILISGFGVGLSWASVILTKIL